MASNVIPHEGRFVWIALLMIALEDQQAVVDDVAVVDERAASFVFSIVNNYTFFEM